MEEPDYTHFNSIPWCSALLSDPAYKITPTFSREPKLSTEDSLVAETLNTPSTIKACLTVYKIPPLSNPFITEVQTVLTLGEGMNGGPHVLHGGITAALIDDIIGVLLTVNKELGNLLIDAITVTAYMNVRYLKRIGTPCTVVVAARCKRVEGRKYFMEAEVRDGEGVKLAEADSLWILLAERKERL
jgi:acyl-coenzyme A thioesterase PaaI-like protein